MNAAPFSLWVYLTATPLLWLTLTLIVWLASDWLAAKTGRNPLANPVLIAILIIGAVLHLTRTAYSTYFEGAQFIHFLLGPATVAIAVPLVRNRALVVENLVPMLVALIAGSATAIVSVVLIARLFGLPENIVLAAAPKSATAPVAMGITESLGGDPSLTAILVVSTGILGAIIVTPLMNALRISDFAARGFAVGLNSHGIGTARAFNVDQRAGTFAGIAMGLNAITTALILPPILALL